MIEWIPFYHENKIYKLEHLHPFSMELIQLATKDKPERIYKINVAFSIHCFTYAYKPEQIKNSNLEYKDSRETRVFCFERYELSKKLPEIIKEITEKKCYHTGVDNYFIIELINDETGKAIQYEIYFKLSRGGRRKGLNLYVQSAYSRDEEHKASSKKKKKPIRFTVLAHNTQLNKIIRVPK